MNEFVKRMLADRMRSPMEHDVDHSDYDDGYMDGYADARRGVRGMGRMRSDRMDRDSMDRMDSRSMDRMDRRSYMGGMDRMDRMDRANSEMYLSKSDISQWKQMLQNADGTDGPHFTLEKIRRAADSHGIKYDKFDEKELYMTANMLYSDLCEALRSFIPPDREAIAYTKMAEAFLCDDDGPHGSTKLALYYHCIANYE